MPLPSAVLQFCNGAGFAASLGKFQKEEKNDPYFIELTGGCFLEDVVRKMGYRGFC